MTTTKTTTKSPAPISDRFCATVAGIAWLLVAALDTVMAVACIGPEPLGAVWYGVWAAAFIFAGVRALRGTSSNLRSDAIGSCVVAVAVALDAASPLAYLYVAVYALGGFFALRAVRRAPTAPVPAAAE